MKKSKEIPFHLCYYHIRMVIIMSKQEFLHGSVLKLTREDTEKDIEQSFITMKENGLDTVVIWPSSFWWEEKKEGYPFNTGRKVLELAEEHGIKVIMELAGQLTVMEYIPDSLMKSEYMPTDENGNIIWGANSFGYLNYFHPEVNKLICENFTKTAIAYKDYPALIGYDVFNEAISRSFDKYTIEEFRKWLRDKYKTIDRLNDVWERTYSDFSQVDFQMWKWMSVMPEADYNIFLKWSMGKILTNWCNAIRKADTEHMLIADNISSMTQLPLFLQDFVRMRMNMSYSYSTILTKTSTPPSNPTYTQEISTSRKMMLP